MAEADIKKAVRQHLEMDAFFTGDFGVKAAQKEDINDEVETVNKKTELEKIARQVSKCCQCGLDQTRTNVVPGAGNPDARIVFVGEAPGADEDAQGLPFIGRAGKLLGEIIKAMGLSREDVFICNTLKCRPPKNRDPKPEEIAQCLPFLKQQLEIISPDMIVALGAHAAKTLLETNKAIGQLRGSFHEYYTSDDRPPLKLMATYHPAYLLRNYSPDNRRKVWDDMKKVLAELGMEAPKG